MPSTFTQNLYHIVFSTKHREPWLSPAIEERLHPFLGGIARDLGCTPLAVNGDADHIHAVLRFPSKLSISDLAMHLKGRSSAWLHGEFPAAAGHGWQDGYGGFTVSSSMLDRVIEYVRRQKDHHARVSFKDELRELMRLHGVDVQESDLFK